MGVFLFYFWEGNFEICFLFFGVCVVFFGIIVKIRKKKKREKESSFFDILNLLGNRDEDLFLRREIGKGGIYAVFLYIHCIMSSCSFV